MPPRSLFLVTLLMVSPVLAAEAPADAAFDALTNLYFKDLPTRQPTTATDLGLHERDGDLEDLSPAAVSREVAFQKDWAKRFVSVDERALSPRRAADLALLRSSIEARRLELEEDRAIFRRADLYPGLASETIYNLIKRDFAPAVDRLRSVVAREEKIPAMLSLGETSLIASEVPPVWVDIALAQMEGIIGFFHDDVPLAFASVHDSALRKRFERTNGAVMKALSDYQTFLVQRIAPHAKGSFVLGEARFRAKLAAEEMINTPLDALLARGEAEVTRLQGQFRVTAAKIDPKRTPSEVQAELLLDHPAPEHLLADTNARLAGLRGFLVAKAIVTIPSAVMPRVTETPPFMRATTFASMSTPGPFEPKATEAYFNVTLPEKGWTAAHTEDFMRGAFSRPLIDVVSIHEAFPGHYVQFLWLPKVDSIVRKHVGASSNIEGWAHYSEQMMLDEGYGGGDPRLRLMQLQDALLRAARYVVGIRLHTRSMTFEEGVAWFEKQGYQSHEVALMEAKRGTYDPTYLYYTLGKLEILRLREDYKKKLGAAYSLRGFHDALLAEGPIPLPLLRTALLSR